MHGHDTAPGRRSRARRPFALVSGMVVLVAVVAVMVACGATPVTLKTATASDLQLRFIFTDGIPTEYPRTALPPGKALVTVIVDTQQGYPVIFAGGQRISCDDIDMLHPDTSDETMYSQVYHAVLLDSDPPGNQHRCTYTDERGQQTTVVLAMPTGKLSIISPAVGAKVPIPPFSGPELTPASSEGRAHTPLSITYTRPILPSGAQGTIEFAVECRLSGPEYTSAQPLCSENATATYTSSDQDRAGGETSAGTSHIFLFPLSQNIASVPADSAGAIDVQLDTVWSPAPQGFAYIQVELHDRVINDFTWVAPKKK